METDKPLPRYIAFALMGLEIDPILAETYVEGFARRWRGLDHDALVRALRNGAGNDTVFAIRALGYLQPPDAVEQLLPTVESTEPLERWESALQLAKLHEGRAGPVLRQALTEYLPSRFGELQVQALSALDDRRIDVPQMLAELGDETAIPALTAALHHVVHLIAEGSLFAEAEAVELGALPSSRSELSTAERDRIQAALRPGRRTYVGADHQRSRARDALGWYDSSAVDSGVVNLLLDYADEIVYALGRLHALGALTELPAPALYNRLWMVHLIMGHLHDNFSSAQLRSAFLSRQQGTEIDIVLKSQLQQVFGLDEKAQMQAVMLYSAAKGMMLALRLEVQEMRRSQDEQE